MKLKIKLLQDCVVFSVELLTETKNFFSTSTQQSSQQQQNSNQDLRREIKDLHQQHTKSDNPEANLMRMFQNFTASTSSSAINNANNFIKTDKKLSSDKQQTHDAASQKQSNEIRLPS